MRPVTPAQTNMEMVTRVPRKGMRMHLGRTRGALSGVVAAHGQATPEGSRKSARGGAHETPGTYTRHV